MNKHWKPAVGSSDKPLYLAIAEAISRDVRNGTLEADTRLPTHRELADSMGLALGTVTRAYAEAQRRGVIRSEGRRGTFVGETRSSLSFLSKMAKRPRIGVDLSKNHPACGLDPDLRSTLRRLARTRFDNALLEYPSAPGIARHRECGAKWMNLLGAEAKPELVFVTAGAQHALSVIFAALTQRGDIVASEDFTYPGVKAIAELLDLQMLGIPMDEDGMLPDAIEAACRKRRIRLLYCNPSLQNPTGSVCPASRRKDIASVAAKYGLTIVEDEIMRPLLSDHPGFISNMLPDQSFLIVSASKAIAAGLRVGFILAPPGSRQQMVDSINASCLGVSPLTVEVFSVWLDDGTVEKTAARRIEDTASRQKLAGGLLRGLEFSNHPSSYHLWLKLPEGWSSMRFAMEAQLRGAVITPGEFFCVDPRPSVEAVRLSITVPPTLEILESGIRTVSDLLRGQSERDLATV